MFFFEGSEKKAEIIVNADVMGALTQLPVGFWHELVSACDAKILSSIENEHCSAYLLSESSLFVWKNRLLLVTCGTCQLVNAIVHFFNSVDKRAIEHVSYQRKNEYFSHAQPSCFGDDAQLLSRYIDGKGYCFGELDSHHNYLFHQHNNYEFSEKEQTYGFVAYQIGKQASEFLTQTNLQPSALRAFFNIEALLPGFTFDDHCFSPFGYSLNAIKGSEFLTLHVTPQAHCSYISIESNINLLSILPAWVDLLSPQSIDLLARNNAQFPRLIAQQLQGDFIPKTLVSERLSNKAHMAFAHYILPAISETNAVEINIHQNDHSL